MLLESIFASHGKKKKEDVYSTGQEIQQTFIQQKFLVLCL